MRQGEREPRGRRCPLERANTCDVVLGAVRQIPQGQRRTVPLRAVIGGISLRCIRIRIRRVCIRRAQEGQPSAVRRKFEPIDLIVLGDVARRRIEQRHPRLGRVAFLGSFHVSKRRFDAHGDEPSVRRDLRCAA